MWKLKNSLFTGSARCIDAMAELLDGTKGICKRLQIQISGDSEMRFLMLDRKVTWSGWQLATYKWSVLAFGLLIGAYFPEVVKSLALFLLPVFLVCTFFVFRWWFGGEAAN